MTQNQRLEIEKTLKKGQIAVSTRFKKTGTNEKGYPTFETVYIDDSSQDVPKNHTLIEVISEYNCAILEDLDYKAVQDEPTNNA